MCMVNKLDGLRKLSRQLRKCGRHPAMFRSRGSVYVSREVGVDDLRMVMNAVDVVGQSIHTQLVDLD